MVTPRLMAAALRRLLRHPAVLLAISLVPGAAGAEGLVGVLLTGPRVGTVGEQVAFEVELVNRSGQSLTQLRVIDYFDEGLKHPASASPIEQKGTVDLAAGTSRRLTLEFQLVKPGRQCHRVEILDQNSQSVGGGTACVEAVPANSPAAAARANPTPPADSAAAVSPPAVAGPPPVAAPPAAGGQPPVATGNRSEPSMPQPVPQLPAVPPATAAGPSATGTAPPAAGGPEPAGGPAAPPGGGVAAAPWQRDGAAVPPAGQPPTPPPPLPNMAALATSPQSKAAFEVGLEGPAELSAGGVAEFVVTVRNIGTASSETASLEVSWDPSLTPLEASDGYTLGRDRATWSLPAIAAGGRESRQINFRGMAGSPAGLGTRACVRTLLGGLPGGGMVADEACVVIQADTAPPRSAADAGLRLSLADLDDPVRFGGGTTLVCTISNDGDRPTGPLDLTISLPEQARIVGTPIPSRVRVDGGRVTFDGISSLPAGGRTTCELVYRMATADRAEATAVVVGKELDGRLEASCATTFLGP